MSAATQRELDRYTSVGNPSSFYPEAQDAKNAIDARTKQVLSKVLGGVNVYEQFQVIFTSGASEANATFLRMVKDAFDRQERRPVSLGVLTSAVEHHSMLAAVKHTPQIRSVTVDPGPDGVVSTQVVNEVLNNAPFIQLVSIMSANNETGAINPVNSIGRAAHAHRAIFHTDATQTFGKLTHQSYQSVDALSMSFHKVYGPIGVGMLLIKKSVVRELDLQAVIPGTQNDGLRGGTVNAALIMAGLHALDETWHGRAKKNAHLRQFQNCLIKDMRSAFHGHLAWFEDFVSRADKSQAFAGTWVLVFGPKAQSKRLPNTLQFTVYDHGRSQREKLCNVRLRSCLHELYGIVVSIGSACLTSSKAASHVLDALVGPVPPQFRAFVKSGVIRVSFGDHNTQADCKTFVDALTQCVQAQYR